MYRRKTRIPLIVKDDYHIVVSASDFFICLGEFDDYYYRVYDGKHVGLIEKCDVQDLWVCE